jgi:hypothetical protein
MNVAVPAYVQAGFRIDPSIARKSGLDKLAKSPAHYLEYCRTEDNETPALLFGRALHAYVLEQPTFAQRFAVAPEFGDLRTNAGKAAKAAFLAEAGNRQTVKADDFDTIRRMADAIMAHPTARNLVVAGQAEKEIAWTDERTGLRCGARVDFHIPELRIAVDLKSTEDASPWSFARSVASYRYHVQDVHYRNGLAAIGEPVDHFVFVAVEKSAPYAVSVCYCDDAAIDRGEQLLAHNMDTLAECVRTNRWPAYGDDLQPVALPAWAFYD